MAGATSRAATPSLRTLREGKMLTQHQLALVSGVSSPTINRMERGAPAYYETIRKLARALDVDPSELLGKVAS